MVTLNLSDDVRHALAAGHKVRLATPGLLSLHAGRELVNQLQQECRYPLCYVQRLGVKPELIVWRMTTVHQAMAEYKVGRYEC